MKASTPLRRCAKNLLALSLLFSATFVVAKSSDDSEALRKACQYLWNQQADDGGWHSPQYAVMRSGQALTPFVLHTLLTVPESAYKRPENGVKRGLDFIRQHVDKHGALGHADPDITEYPVYSTSYALRCLIAVKNDPALAVKADAQLTSRMYAFLSDAQFHGSHGFAPTHPAFGGWGFDVARENGNPGHMDLAHTRRALEAFRAMMPDQNYPQFTMAELFLRVVQRDPGELTEPSAVRKYLYTKANIPFDGGFYFSPVVEEANKGGFDDTYDGKPAPHFRSYATATCDGLLALLACGVSRDDHRVSKAIQWLGEHDDVEYPQGIPREGREPWGEAVRFYHYAVRAEAYAAVGWPGDWRTRLTAAVAKHQATDGSFRNTASPLMKEDDPILCTTLATVALFHCRERQKDKLTHP